MGVVKGHKRVKKGSGKVSNVKQYFKKDKDAPKAKDGNPVTQAYINFVSSPAGRKRANLRVHSDFPGAEEINRALDWGRAKTGRKSRGVKVKKSGVVQLGDNMIFGRKR